MKFLIGESREDQKFSLIYRDEDYSFDIEPHNGSGFASILINDLQLEIDGEGRILYVWGLCPLIKYEKTDEVPQRHKANSLIALLNKTLIPGISHSLNENSRWPIYINKKKGWVCIGNPKTKNKQMIEFAPNCIATMEGQELTAIWLHPRDLPDLNN
jgi:hypothetical protein